LAGYRISKKAGLSGRISGRPDIWCIPSSNFSSLFLCRIRDEKFSDPDLGLKNVLIRIRDKTSQIRNTETGITIVQRYAAKR
jgi:hypothetical protein